MTPPLFTPYETRIEMRCRGGLLTLPESVWHTSARLGGAQIVSEYRGDGVISYILSLSSLFIFDSSIVLICCSQNPFDRMLSFWRESLCAVAPYALFIEKRFNPFGEGERCEKSASCRPISVEAISSFGFENLGCKSPGGDPTGHCYLNSSYGPSDTLEGKKYLMYESWGRSQRETPPHHLVAMVFSPRFPLRYSLIEEWVRELPVATIDQLFRFTPSGFSSNHLHRDRDGVQGYSTIHYSEGSYLSIECCTLVRDEWYETLPFHSLVQRVTSEVQPKEVVIIPDWSTRPPLAGNLIQTHAEL